MKLEIEIPEVTCSRCNTVGTCVPNALQRTAGPAGATDSEGNNWIAVGASVLPQSWTKRDDKPLCATCTVSINDEIEKATRAIVAGTKLVPQVVPEPVKTAATSIPALAAPPVVGRVIGASPTPTQAAARVTGGARIYSNPVMRPEPVVSASPVLVQPSAISRPIAPAAPQRAPQASAVLIGPPKIHAPITPAERGSNVAVASNTSFPQPKVQNAQPVPMRSDVPRVREVAVQNNEEVEPQGPVTSTAIIRGAGV